jgi:hypothetical protein
MRRTLVLTAAVCCVAVGMRLHTLGQIPAGVWFGTENERVAVALARGQGWSGAFAAGTGPTAHVSPLYSLLLAGVYRLCGTYETTAGQRAQACLSIALAVLNILLLPLLARRLGLSVAAGWAAALLASCLPANLWNEVTGSHDQVVATLALLVLVGTCAHLQRRQWAGRRTVLAAGFLTGLAILLFPSLLLVPFLFFLAEWGSRPAERRRIVRCGLAVLVVSLVVMAPWMVRNYVVLGGFVPLRSNFGLELAVGNRPGANGATYTQGMGDMHPFFSAAERARLVQVGELAYMRAKQRQALAWIAGNPAAFARLTLRRALLFWFTPDERWYSLEPRRLLSARIYGLLGMAVILELLRLLWRRHPAGRLLACALVGVALPYFVTHVEMRYRLPVVGLFALLSCNLAAANLRWARDWLRPPVLEGDRT